MAKKTTLAAGTSPFAHLLGGAAALAGRALGKKAEDETPMDEEGPTDEDDVPGEIEDVEEPKDGKKARKAKKAESESDDDDDQDVEADADDKDDVDAEGEDDKEQAAYQRGLAMGRAREGKRCSRIFLAPGAAGRPDLAATLAFTTRSTSAEAGRLMSVVGATPRRGASLDDRMASRSDARPGAGGGQQPGKQSLADKIVATKARFGVA